MRKSIKLTTLFACIATFIVSLILSISLFVMPVKAEAGSVFQMKYGASVQLSKNGLRFQAKMDQAYYDMIVTNDTENKVSLYGYIAPVEEFDRVTEYSDFIAGGRRVGGKLNESKIHQEEDGYYYANIVMTNLDQYTYQGMSFSAIMFIEDMTSGSPVYTYAELALDEDGHFNIEAQNRLQYQIVNAAFLDGKENYESRIMDAYGSWFGSESYPILIATETEYQAFVSKLSADTVFANKVNGKYVFIKQAVSDAVKSYASDKKIANFVTVTENAGHIVTFFDGNKILKLAFVADGADAGAPAEPTKDAYKFVEWIGNMSGITADTEIYAKWKPSKTNAQGLVNMSAYGVTRADGTAITENADVIGKKVVLTSGDLGDGAYYPGITLVDGTEYPNPTDKDKTANQAYLAYDGSYGFNDYFVADFTGKNMPTMAFFANGYDHSIFYGNGTKNGVVVATGFTWPNGFLFVEDGEESYSTSVFNGKGLCMWGPHMIYNTGHNQTGNKNVLLHQNDAMKDVALGRDNLISGKHYRIIMGMQPGDDLSNRAIKLVYVLYDLDNDCIVESKELNSYNFFADGWSNQDQTRDQFCLGSIVAYGYFGTPTVLDKTYAIYEDTTIEDISIELGMQSSSNVTFDGDQITLGTGSIGIGANYTQGQNAGGTITQSYFALNGEYDYDDYVVFDFTGKNMPEVMFFAKNYDSTMYYSEGKQGVVVASGITLWDGTTGAQGSAQANNTKVGVSGPFGAYFAGAAAPYGGNMLSDFDKTKLARAYLEDGKQYRIAMGITKADANNAFTLKYMLYNLTDDVFVEEINQTSWAFFTGEDEAVNNLTLDDLSGAIVLYGKFGTTCTIDKLHGVYKDTTLAEICSKLQYNQKTVQFNNYDGTPLMEMNAPIGSTVEYSGETPYRPGDAVFSSYEFIGWDKEISAVTDDVTYTAVFMGTKRECVTFSGDAGHTYGVEQNNNKIVLKKSNLGDGANYTIGQNNDDGIGNPSWVHQSYLAFDGNYGLNDYVAFDFTGKNLPEIAFFANNYNDSMYAEGTAKEGIVVVTGITTWDGQLESGVGDNGKQINYGFPYMIQNASDGNFVQGAHAASALGRKNLVDGTHYRVIMGFTEHAESARITLKWYLYNLDTNAVVEESSMSSWGFFTGSNAQVGNKTRAQLAGSIVLYGKFGATTTLDRVYGVFEDTNIANIAAGLNGGTTYTVTFKDSGGNVLQTESVAYGAMPEYKGELPTMAGTEAFDFVPAWDKELSLVTGDVTYTLRFVPQAQENTTHNNVTATDNKQGVILGAGSIGGGANYQVGQNAGGTVTQSYLAFDGEYGFKDYIVFDFTGKNMPEVMFFAKNYDSTMYYSEGKQGVVVASGITLWDGTTGAQGSAQANNTKVGVSGPFGAYFAGAAAPYGGNMLSDFDAKLARAYLEDGTEYRIIMGIKEAGTNAFTLEYILYNITTDEIVETVTQTSWAFFTGENPAVDSMKLDALSGSIVLYGKFGTTCTIDKFYGIYEDTTLEDVAKAVLIGDEGEGEGEGGSGSEPEEPSSNVPDYSKYTDQFDFYAYNSYSDGTYEIDGQKYYIGKNLANLKQYALYGEAGMTIYFPQKDALITSDATTVERAKALIDDLAKVGITKTILQDSRILELSLSETPIVGDGCAYATETLLDRDIYRWLKPYATYEGVYGIMLGDEPKYACLSAYAAVYNSIKRVCAKYSWDLFIQYNLNPLNVTQEVYDNYYPATDDTYEWDNYRYKYFGRDRFADAVKRYTQYVNDFLTAMNPDSIMYDDYPLMENKNGNLEIKDSYIPCLQIVAKAAADKGIKFYHVTQAYENNADGMIHRRQMTEKGAKWLNNILIGFGAKQIAYYTYYTRAESDSTGAESYVDGSSFVDYNGNPTELYGWMQKIMANNQKFAPTVLQFDYKGSKLYGSKSANHLGEITVSNSFTKLTACSVNTGSALVTELYDDENDYYMYMAMNVLDPDTSSTAETVTMSFAGYSNVLVYVDGVATSHALTSNQFKATLNPGEAVYVIPYN